MTALILAALILLFNDCLQCDDSTLNYHESFPEESRPKGILIGPNCINYIVAFWVIFLQLVLYVREPIVYSKVGFT